MADLIAQGKAPKNTWRRTFPEGPVTLGRSTTKSTWDVPWDMCMSRISATLTWEGGNLLVRKVPAARSQTFYHGAALDEFTVSMDEEFVIGETTFTLRETELLPESTPEPAQDLIEELRELLPESTPEPAQDLIEELIYSHQELRQYRYDQNNEKIEVLASLPDMIRNARSDEELCARLVEVLLRGLPQAEAVAIVRVTPSETGGDQKVEVLFSKCRDSSREGFQPSRRLILEVLTKRRQSTIQLWSRETSPAGYTVSPNMDWGICVPLPEEPDPGWGFYLAGRYVVKSISEVMDSNQDRLKGEVKFIELVADILSSIRHVCYLQRQQAHLSSFLSRPVRFALANRNIEEVLQPREAEVTVLFCDIRGSCRIADEGQHDLRGLWNRVSDALNYMTSSILDRDGVIGDFQGDAAMGFWGWPLETSNDIERGARAALTIVRHFKRAAQQTYSPMSGFTCGIGISSGRAFVGRLGTQEQFKVGVFGPIVNLASRLESMAKLFRVPIILDERTAQYLTSSQCSHWARCRRLARVQPYGMDRAIMVSELLSSFEYDGISDRHLRDYEAALDAFLEGDWAKAQTLLQRVPPDDGASLLLSGFMKQHHNEPPTNWSGVIPLESK